jgi:RNA polymerase sigma factor (sigma-70 family)
MSELSEPSDMELLRAYACDARDESFAPLMNRHRDWIFAAARRRLRDDHLADDVTQAVFVLLAEKASKLAGKKHNSLTAWLFHVMHFACARTLRSRSRREKHEREKPFESRDMPPPIDDVLLLLLEDTIAQLPPIDRDAIVRRFYQQQDFAGIGVALNITPEAARKRLTRALANIRTLMLRDNVEAIPDELLSVMGEDAKPQAAEAKVEPKRIWSLAKGTMDMVEQSQTMEFSVMSAEFYVSDVEANLDFFEKLGFRPRWSESPDAMGRLPRASLAAGAARIWLRRASETDNTRPSPGVAMYFWIEGGADALTAHRAAIAAQGVTVSPFFDDHTLRNFTVTTPDGYRIGFFTSYR